MGKGLRFSVLDAGLSYLLGTAERPVQEALARYIKPGTVFYDIGANLGFFTVIGAKLVGPAGRVYAFEPVAENAETLRRNIALNHFDHVTVFEKAVSCSSGVGELLLVPDAGGATLSSTGTVPSEITGTTSVDLVSLDDLVASQMVPPPAVVKIDVEGAEWEVLQGMVNTIKASKPVLIYEIDDRDTTAFLRKRDQLEAFVNKMGYDVAYLKDAYPGAASTVGHAVATPAEVQPNSNKTMEGTPWGFDQRS